MQVYIYMMSHKYFPLPGRQQTVLRGPQRAGHAAHLVTIARHDGQRSGDAQRGGLQPGKVVVYFL